MTAPKPNSVDRNLDNFFITSPALATAVDRTVWIATRHCLLRNVREAHSVVGGAGAVVRPRKVTDTSAPGAAASSTVLELTTADIDLTTTIDTVQTPTLSATSSVRRFKPGDRLCENFGGTLTGLVGVTVYEFEPV